MDKDTTAPSKSAAGAAKASKDTPPVVTRDPICAMEVATDAGKPTHEHQGHVYYFCCAGCRDKFIADPDAYMKAQDLVCGMSVDRATARHLTTHNGARFYF